MLVNRNSSPTLAASLLRRIRNPGTHDDPIKVVGATRQCQTPPGALTPHPGSLVGPTVGEKEACLEVFVEQQDWDETNTSHWPESSRVLVLNGVEPTDESGTVPDTQQVSQTQPMPVRVTAAPGNLRQTPPAVKSPPPHDSRGTPHKNETQFTCNHNEAPRTPQGSSSNHHDF